MVRLPQPGGDKGSWGTVLNEFLSVTHNNDGTIKTGTITETALDTSLQTKVNGTVGPQGPVGPTGPAGPQGTAGTAGAQGPTGPAGAQGPMGPEGPAGVDGAGIAITGSVANYAALPSTLGPVDAGNAYLVDADGKLYIWSGTAFPPNGSGVDFRGPTGPTGPQGPAGPAGSTDWADITSKPAVIAAGATQAAARTAIGAGTGSSDLTLGTTGTTAAAGNHTHTVSGISASGTPSASTYLRGDGSWSTPAGGTVTSANITDATVTGRNVLTATDAAAARTAIALGNVDNTSDANKPISTATQTALNAKQTTLVSGTNIKTVNGTSILGSGDIAVSGGGSSVTVLGASDPIPGGTPNGLIVRLPAGG